MADHSYQVVILERHVLCRCDFLLPNRRTMPSLRPKSGTLAQTRHQKRNDR
jgi:hypothetical protein